MMINRAELREAVYTMLGDAPTSVEELRGAIMQDINTARMLPHFVSLEHRPKFKHPESGEKDPSFLIFLSPECPPDELIRLVTVLKGSSTELENGFPEAEIALSTQAMGVEDKPGLVRMDMSPYHNVVRVPYGKRLEKIRREIQGQAPVQIGRSLGHSSPSPGAGG